LTSEFLKDPDILTHEFYIVKILKLNMRGKNYTIRIRAFEKSPNNKDRRN